MDCGKTCTAMVKGICTNIVVCNLYLQVLIKMCRLEKDLLSLFLNTNTVKAKYIFLGKQFQGGNNLAYLKNVVVSDTKKLTQKKLAVLYLKVISDISLRNNYQAVFFKYFGKSKTIICSFRAVC